MGNSSRVRHLVSLVLLAAAWLVSNHYPPWAAFHNEFITVLGILALALTLASLRRPLWLPTSSALILVLGAVPLLQYICGLIYFLGDALISIFYLVAFALGVALGANYARVYGVRSVESLACTFLIGALISVVLALHQWLQLQHLGIWLVDLPPGGRPYANLAQPNNLATLLAMGLAAALYLRERGYYGRSVLGLVAFVLLAGIAMTRSRMAFFIIVAVAAWMIWGRKRVLLKCSATEAFIGLSVFVSLWLAWPIISDSLYLSADSAVARLGSSFGGELRWTLWQQIIDAISRQPLSGYGWNQVSVAQVSVADEYRNSAFTEYSHNLILDLLVWNGVLLGGIILALIGWWLVTRIREIDSPESWFALLLVFALGIHSMFEYPHAYAYFLIPVGLGIGIIEAPRAANALQISRPVYAVALAVFIFFAGAFFLEYQRIESDYRLMRFEAARIERDKPISKAPDVIMLTQLREFIRLARTEARTGMSAEEIDWMRKVAHRYAYPPALFRYALALGLNGRPLEAEVELGRLRGLHPQHYSAAQNDWKTLVRRYPLLSKVSVPR